MPPPDSTTNLRAEIKRFRSPLYAGFSPLLDAFDRHIAASAAREEKLEQRVHDLERQVAALSDPAHCPQLSYGGPR